MKKILFISPEVPWPLDTGGKIRSFNILKELSQKYEIVLVSFGKKKNLLGIRKYIKKAVIIPHHLNLFKKFLNLFFSMMSEKPTKVLNFYSPLMKEAIDKTIKKENPQILYFEHIYMASYLKDIGDKEKFFKIIDTHNVYFHFFTSLSKSQNKIKALINRGQIEKMKQYEAKIYSLSDLVLVCSPIEKQILLKTCPGLKIEVVPNGVDLELYQSVSPLSHSNRIIFIGSFDHYPNEEGVLWFVENVLPRIKKRIKNFHIYLIGRQPSRRIKELNKISSIKVLGYVKDIKSYLLESKVFIVPLFAGGGTRLKILEAMAARVPVISTSKGAEGLKVKDGRDIFIADNAEEFAQKLIQLFTNQNLSQKIIQNAYQLVKENYQWSTCLKPLITAINPKF